MSIVVLDIYREFILDHYKNPRNFGEIKDADFKSKESNIFCGDSIEVFGKLSAQGKGNEIKDIKFKGRGCVISQASASILTDFVKGKTVGEIEKLSVEDIVKMLGVSLSPTRMRCAELSLVALKKSLNILK